jgi:hypothetical protein
LPPLTSDEARLDRLESEQSVFASAGELLVLGDPAAEVMRMAFWRTLEREVISVSLLNLREHNAQG